MTGPGRAKRVEGIRIGTRGSALARAQAERVRARLAAAGVACEILIVKSGGDADPDAPIASLGVGIFTKELEDALLARRIDAAVHSLKDLPSQVAPGLALAAVPEREDVRDAVVGKRLADLPRGARVGSSSPRRQEWLARAWPALSPVPIRGNVDTRLRKLDAGEFDALLMAAAGLRRLGFESRVAELLPLESMIPPAGQGALAVETRAGEEDSVSMIDDAALHAAVEAERALFRELRAGCKTPLGAYAEFRAGRIHLRADLAGHQVSRDSTTPAEAAREVAAELRRVAPEAVQRWLSGKA